MPKTWVDSVDSHVLEPEDFDGAFTGLFPGVPPVPAVDAPVTAGAPS